MPVLPPQAKRSRKAAVESSVRLGQGTKIKFVKLLKESPPDVPEVRIFAHKGDTGKIVGHGCHEGYWVLNDKSKIPFGVSRSEFELLIES